MFSIHAYISVPLPTELGIPESTYKCLAGQRSIRRYMPTVQSTYRHKIFVHVVLVARVNKRPVVTRYIRKKVAEGFLTFFITFMENEQQLLAVDELRVRFIF